MWDLWDFQDKKPDFRLNARRIWARTPQNLTSDEVKSQGGKTGGRSYRKIQGWKLLPQESPETSFQWGDRCIVEVENVLGLIRITPSY